jgi:UDP-N-acetylglucosamine 2-epimerase (non-hydrolysing)
MRPTKIAVIAGIRPDIIRLALLLRRLAADEDTELNLIYTGQHYSANLKDVFFDELGVPKPKYTLDTRGDSHCQQHAKLIEQLEQVFIKDRPDIAIFLGDANAVIGCIVPLKMGIPIYHIEAGMRSFDWRMPEERNRVIIDRVSDRLYCYSENYRINLVREGINPSKIVVCGNTIVDVLKEFSAEINEAGSRVLAKLNLARKDYAVQTLHRDEHINKESVTRIMGQVNSWAQMTDTRVVLPVMPRLSKILAEIGRDSFANYIFTEPLSFFEFAGIEKSARIEFTDSGTNQEAAAIQGVPCVVTREATERPETFDSDISVMTETEIGTAAKAVLSSIKRPGFSMGEGRAAQIIHEDIEHSLYGVRNGRQPHIDQWIKRHTRTF